MKYLFTFCFTLFSYLGISQEVIVENNPENNLDLTINYKGFDTIYSNLRAISENINETTTIIKRFDEIRQGQLIINTENIGQSFEGLKMDIRPSLDVELQRIMFTGNFINPRRAQVIISQ
ncbi:hypothetical protein [Olleya sp. R77988]|uniref:hypothetical protein n=1 Tax=Olleya sp. R77988 TaxID=3093875 RepID=UPI0037CCB555